MRSSWPIADWRFGALGVGAVLVLLGMEVATEPDGVSPLELLLEFTEVMLTIGAAVAIALMFGRLKVQHEETIRLMQDLQAAREDGERWRLQSKSHIDGLSAAMREQFHEWKLSDAESEVCLLLIKGMAHREIAVMRGTSEATVRQQARAAYQKSGLKGRASLCAYFLEDLMPAGGERDFALPASRSAVMRNVAPSQHA